MESVEYVFQSYSYDRNEWNDVCRNSVLKKVRPSKKERDFWAQWRIVRRETTVKETVVEESHD